MPRETYQSLRSARWFAREVLCDRAGRDRADWTKRNMAELYNACMSGASYGGCAPHVAQTDKGRDFDFLISEIGHPMPEPEVN